MLYADLYEIYYTHSRYINNIDESFSVQYAVLSREVHGENMLQSHVSSWSIHFYLLWSEEHLQQNDVRPHYLLYTTIYWLD